MYNVTSLLPGLTWNGSRSVCQILGGDLLKLDTEEESGFIDSLIQGQNIYWIGEYMFLLKI